MSSREVAYACVDVSPTLLQIKPDAQPPNVQVMVMGSSSLGKIAKQKMWVPGYFDVGLDYKLYLHHYGDAMLNHNAIVIPFGQAISLWEQFFIRPVADTKLFTGQVMTRDNFLGVQKQIAQGKRVPGFTLGIDDEVVIAPIQNVYAEYRFWVVDGCVVTYSRYKLGQQALLLSQVDEEIVMFAQKQVDRWQPDRAFVIDIADTDTGLKVIEINAINSSALYAGDAGKLVEAIELMGF